MAKPTIIVQLWINGRINTTSIMQFPEGMNVFAAQSYKQVTEVARAAAANAEE